MTTSSLLTFIKHLPTKSSLEAAEWGVLVPGSIFNESLH